MKLRIDPEIEYAVALEGGGAKGSYQIGAWKALREAGIKICAVSGTSVGAINGAMIASDEFEKAERLWLDINYSTVMDVDEDFMRRVMGDFKGGIDLSGTLSQIKDIFKNRGFDVKPLHELLSREVDEERIRSSPIPFYIITYSLTDRKELELKAQDLEPGTLHDMLLASAYLPVFKNEKLGDKRYLDGGVRDVLPLHALSSNGYKNILALKIQGLGYNRRFTLPEDTVLHVIQPREDLGNALKFEKQSVAYNMKLGYFDAKRMLYGLAGNKYYIDREKDERASYELLLKDAVRALSELDMSPTLLEINQKYLPGLAKALKVKPGDYDELWCAVLEGAAEKTGAERFEIYTVERLTDLCGGALFEVLKQGIKKGSEKLFGIF